MASFYRSAWSLLAAWVIIYPIALKAQSGSEKPLLTEQQRIGEALFRQNCPLCHVPVKKRNKDPNEVGTPRAKSLAGMFRGEKPLRDDVAAQIILKGIPQKMPGFQYTLQSKEIEDIIAYLHTL